VAGAAREAERDGANVRSAAEDPEEERRVVAGGSGDAAGAEKPEREMTGIERFDPRGVRAERVGSDLRAEPGNRSVEGERHRPAEETPQQFLAGAKVAVPVERPLIDADELAAARL